MNKQGRRRLTMEIAELLLMNAVIVAAGFFVLWRIAVIIGDASFVDSFWALGMVVIAFASLDITHGQRPHGLILTGLCAAWGVRLGMYLLWRWHKQGPDRRYKTMMGKAQTEKGLSFEVASLRLVFALQAPLLFIVCLPVQLGQRGVDGALGPLGIAGMSLAVLGIGFETLADAQLAAFKSDPAHEGKVLDKGLWRYTRHPNYFGDLCVWWGLYLIAAETGFAGVLSIPGPILLTFLLTQWSGIPTLEGRLRRRPEYAAYAKRTSSLIPMPPKRS
jgi:steroid 5-alpha reductase family enzyme